MVCRYLPGARTATTLTAGTVGYPVRSFTAYDALAGISWGLYCALIGYIGGAAFGEHPIRGLLLGLGLALGVTALAELVRHLRRRSHAGSAAG